MASPFTPSTIPGGALPSEWTVGADGSLEIDSTSPATDFANALIYRVLNGDALLYADGGGDLEWKLLVAGTFFEVTRGAAGESVFEVASTGVSIAGGTDPVTGSGGLFDVQQASGAQGGSVRVTDFAGGNAFEVDTQAGKKLGFFGTAPIVKPNVGAVPTALSIATALVALGLVDSS